MFALMPWTRRPGLLPSTDLPDEFGTLVNRLLTNPFLGNWPMIEAAEGPDWWGLTTEENDKELMIRIELPGFEPAEVKVEVTGERLAVEAAHKEPEGTTKERNGRAYAHVKRTITLPPELETEKVEATFRNGVLEVHIPRMPEAVGRRIEVKT